MNNDHLRVAFAANLNRSADKLERLAATLTTADATQPEILSEMQAQRDAGAAIWGATLQGFLTTPEIVGEVQGLAGNGHTEVDTTAENGAVCANLFLSVMREFIYPIGESVAPYTVADDEEWPMTEAKHAAGRQTELEAEATGCRIIARLIEMTPEAAEAVADWYYSIDDLRPDHFQFGPLPGTQKELNEWVGGPADRNASHLHAKGRRGRIWIVKRDRTTYEVWFQSQAEIDAARKMAAAK